MNFEDINIEEKIQQKFNVIHFKLINNSHLHKMEGNNTHYTMLVISDDFTDMSVVDRHRAIMQVCNCAFKGPLHALSLRLFTQKESKEKDISLTPPNCMSNNQ